MTESKSPAADKAEQDRAEYIEGLRQLADVLSEIEWLPLPETGRNANAIYVHPKTRADAMAWINWLSNCVEQRHHDYTVIRGALAGVGVSLLINDKDAGGTEVTRTVTAYEVVPFLTAASGRVS